MVEHNRVGFKAACWALLVMFLMTVASGAAAQNENARVVVPDAPGGGGKVAGCYRSIGVIYGKYKMDFCLKRRGSYRVVGRGIDCQGRLDWNTRGPGINIRFKRTSCGNGVAWSADTAWCRPNLLLGIIGLITESGHLSGLTCDYRPVPGTSAKPIVFGARRISN